MFEKIRNLYKDKRGYAVADLLPLGMVFVVLAIALSISATVVDDVQNTTTVDSAAYNVAGFGLTSLTTIGSWLPTIALVVVAAVIIGVVILYLARRYS